MSSQNSCGRDASVDREPAASVRTGPRVRGPINCILYSLENVTSLSHSVLTEIPRSKVCKRRFLTEV